MAAPPDRTLEHPGGGAFAGGVMRLPHEGNEAVGTAGVVMISTSNSTPKGIAIMQAEQRLHERYHVEYSGYIELRLSENEIHCKPVVILNISKGGIGIAMHNNSPRIISRMQDALDFTLFFEVPSVGYLFKASCKPVHVDVGPFVAVGASFKDIQ